MRFDDTYQTSSLLPGFNSPLHPSSPSHHLPRSRYPPRDDELGRNALCRLESRKHNPGFAIELGMSSFTGRRPDGRGLILDTYIERVQVTIGA